jgi:hypothetical protein
MSSCDRWKLCGFRATWHLVESRSHIPAFLLIPSQEAGHIQLKTVGPRFRSFAPVSLYSLLYPIKLSSISLGIRSVN